VDGAIEGFAQEVPGTGGVGRERGEQVGAPPPLNGRAEPREAGRGLPAALVGRQRGQQGGHGVLAEATSLGEGVEHGGRRETVAEAAQDVTPVVGARQRRERGGEHIEHCADKDLNLVVVMTTNTHDFNQDSFDGTTIMEDDVLPAAH